MDHRHVFHCYSRQLPDGSSTQTLIGEIWLCNGTKYAQCRQKYKEPSKVHACETRKLYNSPLISLDCSRLPELFSFKYLCDVVLSITNVFSEDTAMDQTRANCTNSDPVFWPRVQCPVRQMVNSHSVCIHVCVCVCVCVYTDAHYSQGCFGTKKYKSEDSQRSACFCFM